MSPTIRLFIADDHPLIAEGIKNLLLRRPDIELVGSASNAEDAIREIKACKPDVVLLDLYFGDVLASEVLSRFKEEGIKSKAIIYTVLPESSFTFELLKLGARGYLNKHCDISEILEAIRVVHRGKTYLSEEVRVGFEKKTLDGDLSPLEQLSGQEYRVMLMLIRGLRNVEIATQLDIGKTTVGTYVDRIYRKLGVRSLPELVRLASLHGVEPL